MNCDGTRVIVAIPGLGDLPGISRNVVVGVEEVLLDVELLLPGGVDKICCILCSRHLRDMAATVRCVGSQSAGLDASRPRQEPETLPCPPTEQAVEWVLPPDPDVPMFDELDPEVSDEGWSNV